ncbi:SCO5918 family protein [Streptomyces sp. NPDC094447]|uniref:SCO5918 family protein n=1 Tax=Streptomyces sp. NPDC094447 TaxID=3366062 RepID=UPI00381E6C83
MRCVIARFPFELTKAGVIASMKGIKPEPAVGDVVVIGRRQYPVKQVGEAVTRQDRRDFSAGEVVRAMTKLGFTCTTVTAGEQAGPAAGPTETADAAGTADTAGTPDTTGAAGAADATGTVFSDPQWSE